MVEKSSPNGELLVYAVDRRSGEPRCGHAKWNSSKRKKQSRRTHKCRGVFRTRISIKDQRKTREPDIPEVDITVCDPRLAQRDFAISDLESVLTKASSKGFKATSTPIGPSIANASGLLQRILRGVDDGGNYRSLKSQTVTVTIKVRRGACLEQEWDFHHANIPRRVNTPEERRRNLSDDAQTDEEAQPAVLKSLIKKTGIQSDVTTPQRFVRRRKSKLRSTRAISSVRGDECGCQVLHRSLTLLPELLETDEPELNSTTRANIPRTQYYSDMVADGEGKLDASGRLEIPFDVPANNEEDVWDFQYRLEAQVTDASRRSINGSANLVATRGSVIARATSDRYVYTPGQTANVKVSTTDYEAALFRQR